MTIRSLSVVVPAYNGAARIVATVDAIIRYWTPRRPVDVIVVDDGSGDETAAIVAQHAALRPALRLIRLPSNRGKGAAVREGVLAAAGEIICFCDADLPIPVGEMGKLVAALEEGDDVAIASRALPESELPVPPSVLRRATSRSFNVIVRRLFGLPFRDTQCGLKGFRREAARAIFSRATIDGFAFDVEMLIVAQRSGFRIGEVPIRMENPPASTVSVRAQGVAILKDLWRIRRNLRQGLYGAQRRAAGQAVRQEAARDRLSAVILTRNEERRVERCLRSVTWADEIIVVDGESTDRTVEICEAYGAKVIPHPFSGDFGLERNIGNDAARGDWILQLDADDAVSPALRAQIEGILRDGSPYAAYKFRRRNWFLGHAMRYGGWYHYYPHLFRRGQAHFEGRVHHLLRSRGPMGVLEGALEHRPFDSLQQFVARHNRYTTIEAQEMLERHGIPDPALVRYHLTRRPLKLFWKTYVKKGGFREGWHGLIFSMLFAWVHFLKWAKYWEQGVALQSREEPPSPGVAGPDSARAAPPKNVGGAAVERRRPREATLAVVLMTKNEASRLASCLDLVAGWADEVVIIDDCSTDRTVEIARRYTARVFSFRSEDNHDLQWNRGIERATCAWILHIDADEVVTPQLKAAIDRALSHPDGSSAFEMMRRNFFLGHPMRYGGWYHRHLVLFRRDRARCVGKGIHVELRVEGATGFLDAQIEHYPFASIDQFIERQNHYTTIEARGMVERHPAVRPAELVYQLLWRPAKLFRKSYVKNHGSREGVYGLVFGLLYAFVHSLRWAKRWELVSLKALPLPIVQAADERLSVLELSAMNHQP